MTDENPAFETPEVSVASSETQVDTIIPEVVEEKRFTIKDISGNVIDVPNILPWGKEKRILGIVGKAFDKVIPKENKQSLNTLDFFTFINEETDLQGDTDFIGKLEIVLNKYNAERTGTGAIDTRELLQFFSKEAPGLITELLSIITAKNESEIDDMFDGGSVMQFAIPYIIHSMRKYAESFTGIGIPV